MLLSLCLLSLAPALLSAHPASDQDLRRIDQALDLPTPAQVEEQEETKRVVRGDPKPEVSDVAMPATVRDSRGLDIPWTKASQDTTPAPEGRTHFSSGIPLSYAQGPTINPHVSFNVQPPVSYNIPAQAALIGNRPACSGGGAVGGCGGQTLHIHETHFATQQVPQTYTASVPYIAGYRLSPVLGQKQIQLNDLAYQGAGLGAGFGGLSAGLGSGSLIGLGGSAPCPFADLVAGGGGGGGYWQNIYGHARQAGGLVSPDGKPILIEDTLWPDIKAASGDEILRPFEAARYFQAPVDTEHGLAPPQEYQRRIEDMRHHIEHMESLRNSAPDTDNTIASS